MYLTLLSSIFTIVAGVLGFIGLDDGSIPIFRIIFFILLATTIVVYIMERRNKRKKYYD